MADASAIAKVLVRVRTHDGPDPAIDVPAGHARIDDGALVVSAAPGEWLVIGPPESSGSIEIEWVSRVGDRAGIVVDMTHARAAVLVNGDRTADLLARVSIVDVSTMGHGTVQRTSMFGVTVDIIRLHATEPAVLLMVDRSYGPFLEALLLDMGTELSIHAAAFSPTVMSLIVTVDAPVGDTCRT